MKHSKSFAVAGTECGSIDELRETARRLTSDSSFRESVYKIMARKDATNTTDVWGEAERGKRRETALSFTSVSESHPEMMSPNPPLKHCKWMCTKKNLCNLKPWIVVVCTVPVFPHGLHPQLTVLGTAGPEAMNRERISCFRCSYFFFFLLLLIFSTTFMQLLGIMLFYSFP